MQYEIIDASFEEMFMVVCIVMGACIALPPLAALILRAVTGGRK